MLVIHKAEPTARALVPYVVSEIIARKKIDDTATEQSERNCRLFIRNKCTLANVRARACLIFMEMKFIRMLRFVDSAAKVKTIKRTAEERKKEKKRSGSLDFSFLSTPCSKDQREGKGAEGGLLPACLSPDRLIQRRRAGKSVIRDFCDAYPDQ